MLTAISEWLKGGPQVEVPQPVQEAAPLHDLTIKDIPDDAPDFRREYSTTIARGIVVTIEIRKGHGNETYTNGELRQPDRKYIFFDPDRPAEKIIDPVLLPEIEVVCREIAKVDSQWRARPILEFTDKAGQRWVRAESVKMLRTV